MTATITSAKACSLLLNRVAAAALSAAASFAWAPLSGASRLVDRRTTVVVASGTSGSENGMFTVISGSHTETRQRRRVRAYDLRSFCYSRWSVYTLTQPQVARSCWHFALAAVRFERSPQARAAAESRRSEAGVPPLRRSPGTAWHNAYGRRHILGSSEFRNAVRVPGALSRRGATQARSGAVACRTRLA